MAFYAFRVQWSVRDYPNVINEETYMAKDQEHAKRIAAADFARIFPDKVILDDSWQVQRI